MNESVVKYVVPPGFPRTIPTWKQQERRQNDKTDSYTTVEPKNQVRIDHGNNVVAKMK
jgi:hypothetical protein